MASARLQNPELSVEHKNERAPNTDKCRFRQCLRATSVQTLQNF